MPSSGRKNAVTLLASLILLMAAPVESLTTPKSTIVNVKSGAGAEPDASVAKPVTLGPYNLPPTKPAFSISLPVEDFVPM